MTETKKSEGDKQLMTVIAYDRYNKAEPDAKRNIRAIIYVFYTYGTQYSSNSEYLYSTRLFARILLRPHLKILSIAHDGHDDTHRLL